MTFARIRELSRRYARASSSTADDTEVNTKINEAVIQFANDVHGFPMESHLAIQAKFDLYTTEAFHLTIVGSTNNDIDSDIVVTDSSTNDMTGTAAATELQAQIRTAIGGSPDLTVAWTNFYFKIDAIDSTSITVDEPTDSTNYTDATDILFGGTGSGTTYYKGGFPEDCTIEANLPSDVISVQEVWWDNYKLYPTSAGWTVNPETYGDPRYYHIKGSKIRLYPSPSEQKRFYIRYRGVPAEVGTIEASTSIQSEIPTNYQKALAYFVAAELLRESFEEKEAQAKYAMYYKIKNQYLVAYNNRSTVTKPSVYYRPLWYDVKT